MYSYDIEAVNNFLRRNVDEVKRRHVAPFQPKLFLDFSPATRRTTAAICNWIADRGMWFACEVPIVGRKRRADIICPELLETEVIEIYDSETMESIIAKTGDYVGAGITIIAVPADPDLAVKMIADANGVPT